MCNCIRIAARRRKSNDRLYKQTSNRMFTAAALRHGEGEFENKKSAYSVSLRRIVLFSWDRYGLWNLRSRRN
jgi:hypothetical protein